MAKTNAQKAFEERIKQGAAEQSARQGRAAAAQQYAINPRTGQAMEQEPIWNVKPTDNDLAEMQLRQQYRVAQRAGQQPYQPYMSPQRRAIEDVKDRAKSLLTPDGLKGDGEKWRNQLPAPSRAAGAAQKSATKVNPGRKNAGMVMDVIRAKRQYEDLSQYQDIYNRYTASGINADGAKQSGDYAAYYEYLAQQAGAESDLVALENQRAGKKNDAIESNREYIIQEILKNPGLDDYRTQLGMGVDAFADWLGDNYTRLPDAYKSDTLSKLIGGGYQYEADTGAIEDTQRMYRDMAQFYSLSPSAQKDMQSYMEYWNMPDSIRRNLSPEEREAYADAESSLAGALGGFERLEEIAQGYQRYMDEQNFKERQAEHQKEVEDGFWSASSLAAQGKAVGASLAGGITGAVQAGQELMRTATGDNTWNTANPYAQGYALNQYANDIKAFTGEQIDNTALNILYSAGMSTMENGARILATSLLGVPGASLGLMAVGSYGNAYQEAAMRGATPMEATMFAGASAALEVLTEKYSLESLLSMESPNDWVDLLKNLGKQGLVEASEEELSYFGGLLADAMIMGDKAELAMEIQGYMDEGMSQEAAVNRAMWGILKDAAITGAESFLSGGMMAAPEQAVQYGRASSLGRDIRQDATAAYQLQDAARQFGPDTEAYQRAQGLTLGDSNAAWGNLYNATVQAQQEAQAAQESEELKAAEQAQKVSSAMSYVNTAISRDIISDKVADHLAGNEMYRAVLEDMTGQKVQGETAEEQRASVRDAIEAWRVQNREGFQQGSQGTQRVIGTEGRKALREMYDGQADSSTFSREFRRFYTAGQIVRDISKVQSDTSILTEEQRLAAWKAGSADAGKNVQPVEAVNAVKPGLQRKGVSGKALGVDDRTANAMNAAAKALGVRVQFAEMAEGQNGKIDSNGVITVNSKAEHPVTVVLAHEMTHRIQDLAPQAYKTYRDYVVGAMAEHSGRDVNDILDSYGMNSQEAAMDEAAADFAWRMMENVGLFRDFINEKPKNQTIGQKLLSALKGLLRRLFRGSEGKNTSVEELKAFGADIHTMQTAAQLWEEALQEAKSGVKNLKTAKVGAQEGKVRFSMGSPVEQTKNLLALHNMTAKNLADALALGGLPSPSIAIVKAQQGHTKYGDISVVFDRSSIDPQADKRNKVYGSDAWTPTAPAYDYKVDNKRAAAFEDLIWSLSQKTAGGAVTSSSILRKAGVNESTEKPGAEIAAKIAAYPEVKAAYMADNGIKLDPVYKAKTFSDDYGNDTLGFIADAVGADELEGIVNGMAAGKSAEQAAGDYYDTVKGIMMQEWLDKNQARLDRVPPETAEKIIRRHEETALYDYKVEQVLFAAWAYLSDSDRSSSTIDRMATAEAIRSAVSNADVEAWVNEKMSGVIADTPGIYNGKSKYTPNGRRSYEQTHDSYTLENIVKAMNSQQSARGQGVFGAGATGIQAIASPEYKSVKAIKGDSARLDRLSDADYTAAVANVDSMISAVSAKIVDATGVKGYMVGDALIYAAKARTVPAVIRAMQESGVDGITQDLAKEILSVFKAAGQLPTEYFEAKPQRAVYFNEPRAFVVPDNLDGALLVKLRNAGAAVLTYKAGEERDRLSVINGIDGARFSKESGLETAEAVAVTAKVNQAVEKLRTAARARDEAYEDLIALTGKKKLTTEERAEIRQLRKTLDQQTRKIGTAQAAVTRAVNDMAVYLEKDAGYRKQGREIIKNAKAAKADAAKVGGNMEPARKGFKSMLADASQVGGREEFEKNVRSFARILMDHTGSTMSQAEAQNLVKSVYAGYQYNGMEGAMEAARRVGREFVATANDPSEGMYETFADFRQTARSAKLVIAREDANDIPDFADFRRRNMGRFNIRVTDDRNEANLNSTVSEWAQEWPGLLDKAIGAAPSDQLKALSEALESVYADRGANPYRGYEAEEAEEIAGQLVSAMAQKAQDRAVSQAMYDAAKAKAEKAEARAKAAEEKAEHLARTTASVVKAQQALDAERAEYGRKMDRELERLEETRKRVKAREKESREEGLKRGMEIAMQTIERVEQEKAEQARNRAAASDNRRRAEAMRGIVRLSEEFNGMILKPKKGDTRHVPKALQGPLLDFCETILDGFGADYSHTQEQLQRRAGMLELMTEDQRTEEDRAAIQRLQERLKAKRDKAAVLAAAYEKLKNDPQYEMYYDKEGHTSGLLHDVQEALAEKPFYAMSYYELQGVYNTMKNLEHMIKNANALFSKAKDKTLVEINNNLVRQMDAAPTIPNVAAMRYAMWQMSPHTFWNFVTGGVKGNEGQTIDQMFSQGTERRMLVEQEFWRHFQKYTETGDKETLKAVRKLMQSPRSKMVSFGMKDAAGQEVKTSLGMALQLHMLLKQKQSFDSIVYGGLMLPNLKNYYGGKADRAYGDAQLGHLLTEAVGEEHQSLVQQIKKLEDRQEELREILEDPLRGPQEKATAEGEIRQAEDQIADIRKQANALLEGAEMRLREIQNKVAAVIDRELPGLGRELIQTADAWYKRTGEIFGDTYEAMYGYRPNLVESYTPIHRNLGNVTQDLRVDRSGTAFNLESIGLAQERVRSTAPIKLTDFFTELSGHTSGVARYSGYAPVQKDFDRILNIRAPGARDTVRNVIAAKFGEGDTVLGVSGAKYIDNYIKSVAGAAKEGDILASFYGNAAATTLRLNPRVALSQAASIPTAAAVVGWGSVGRAVWRGARQALSKSGRAELADTNVWFWNRYRGAGSSDLNDVRGASKFWDRVADTPVGKALFNWCQGMDVLSTASMWAMAEDYVAHNGGAAMTEEARKQAVNDKYTEIIRYTQPNYTETERSDLLRDRRGGMKILTMYKTQSNQNLNILMDAGITYRAMVSDFKAGRNEVTEADVKAARKKLADSITSVTFGGTVAFAALRALVNFALGRVNPYRDEKGEVTAEGIGKGLLKECVSSLMGMFALGGQIYDFVEPLVTDDRYYGLSDSGVALLSEAFEKDQAALKALVDDGKVSGDKLWAAFKSSMALVGMPVQNAQNLYEAFMGWSKGAAFFDYRADKYTTAQYAAQAAEAWEAGDTDKVDLIMAELAARSPKNTDAETQKYVGEQMTAAVRTAFDEGMTSDKAVELLTYVYGSGDAAQEKAQDKVWYWEYQWELPEDYKPTQSMAHNFYAVVAPTGIDAMTWYTISKDIAAMSADKDDDGKAISGTRKAKMVDYIMDLPLSMEQKQAVWDAVKGTTSSKDTPFK